MTKTLTAFVKDLKTAQLVVLFNLANKPDSWKGLGKPGSEVKRFADRATAEKRLVKMMSTWDAADDALAAYNEFYADFAGAAHKSGIELPTPEVAATAPKPAAVKTKEAKPEGEPTKKQNTPPHLNLRCAAEGCGYYAKTTMACLKRARLICPVDKAHGKLMTAEERGEKRGR